MSIPQPGQNFPDFTLPVATPRGDEIEQGTLSLADLKGAPVVLFFYPKDATSGCTIEVCGFRDEYAGFEKLGVKVIGISRDRLSAHLRFIKNQNLPYSLLADPDQTLIKACNLLKNATMYGKPVTKVLRSTFILDENGVVLKTFENVTPLGHAKEVLAWLTERAG